MTKLTKAFVLFGTLLLLPAIARPQYEAPAGSLEGPAAVGVDSKPPSTAQPAGPPPTSPPATTPPPPPAQVRRPSIPDGQWVYTQQYGWIWMPYSDRYAYVPTDGYGEPYAYVYYPAYGWTWLGAPWMWGFGPWPYFGYYGPVRYAWYGHGWWRNPSRWRYEPSRPVPGIARSPTYRGSAGYGTVGHAPFRGSPGARGGGGGFMGNGGARGGWSRGGRR